MAATRYAKEAIEEAGWKRTAEEQDDSNKDAIDQGAIVMRPAGASYAVWQACGLRPF